MAPALKIAVLISGGGTTLENLLRVKQAGDLDVEFGLVISSKRTARGVAIAADHGIRCDLIARRQFTDGNEHSKAVFDACRSLGIDLVVMGGYLDHLLIPSDYENRVVNIHPSLIPSFCGKGFYGLHVHRAAVEYGVKLSGCTVHYVDNQFDHGPIIAQRTCPVLPDDTPETLQQRVFALECELFPETIQAIAQGRVSINDRRVTVKD